MKFCNRCFYPDNHALNIIIDDQGVCSGCRVHEEKYSIDWSKKAEELSNILDQYKNRPGTSYDCVIPVTGVGDDFFVVDLVKNTFGLNPLLVTYNTHFNTKVGVRNLARLITKLDCDHMMSTVGPETIKEITRITLKEFGDMYWHVLAGSQTFPVQVATKLNIPLVIWGVNGWLDQVGMFSHYDNAEMTKKVRKEHAMRGYDAESLLGMSKNISKKDLQAFTYPSDKQLENSRVRGLYIGNYVFWDSKEQTESAIINFGYETHLQERTYNTYESINCFNNASVHDYIKYLKFGYSKVIDHVARDIRLKRLSREKGYLLIKEYLEKKPESLSTFLKWIDMNEEELLAHIDPFRDPKAWSKDCNGEWFCHGSILNSNIEIDTGFDYKPTETQPYLRTELLEEQSNSDEYILLGRTYMDKNNYKAIEG
ncbi:N-acetyl sugar amidotransferase [Oceanospirillum sanctuarii]|uniref:N-acetyl sugar amidotransferase n=1 Tax=Oceanospirillum sanctuarii TaxID=1434821 RepID=UPI000A3740FD|nr:N-acetyl sugar amidotransferase [Oceanospirillum sanctuarii]